MKQRNLNVLIADDHPMIRTGLRMMLEVDNPTFKFAIDEVVNGEEAINAAVNREYDIIITDYRMPFFNGDEVTRRILLHKPEAKIIIMTNYDEKSFIRSCYDAGAMAYLTKNVELDELLKSIKKVLRFKRIFPDDVINGAEEMTTEPDLEKIPKEYGLTKREFEVLKLVAQGLTSDEIAKQLDIGARTAGTHRQNLLYKTNSKNTAELIKFAMNHKIV